MISSSEHLLKRAERDGGESETSEARMRWPFPRRADSNRSLQAHKQAKMTVETLRDGP